MSQVTLNVFFPFKLFTFGFNSMAVRMDWGFGGLF